ncbi:hypothetical protein Pmani_003667 [Petrolisthes manimaculis]|uniref:Uncharacterized protein n=1 Tax=Petrolisthes manimaculis TaxID=1843537 RepID=A0AAE1QFS3_9EUCA|nr:hypothetical protein Pmani_003667 [Petrolisthes manimaculis]
MEGNEPEQMEELFVKCLQKGTECDHIGGTCYHKTEKCNGEVIPDICDGRECYCCLEHDEPDTCEPTSECLKNGVDPGMCVDDVQAYIDLQNYYVSDLDCKYRHCYCVTDARRNVSAKSSRVAVSSMRGRIARGGTPC